MDPCEPDISPLRAAQSPWRATVDPIAGRVLAAAYDGLASATSAAVIGERYWERRFGRSPAAIGKVVTIRDRAFTIFGAPRVSIRSSR